MCLVEEKSSIKPVASCAVTIVAGMSIFTQTEMVKKAREGVIEYLLINHPLDCPICDQGGECDLQDQTMVFGADRGRFYELKRSTPNKNFGFLIKTFLNRCIHCARCTRFLSDIAVTDDLSLLGRGYKTEISSYLKLFIKSEISGNIIDLCPVGALTSKPYAFRARPWELVSVYSFDIVEPFCSNIEINYRGLELLRILPRINNEINEEWVSDKTRFYYDSFNIQRLVSPFIMRRSKYFLSSWLHCFIYWKGLVVNVSSLWLNILKSSVFNFAMSVGEYEDLETVSSLLNFQNRFSISAASLTGFYDFRKNLYGKSVVRSYLFGSNREVLDRFVIVNCNPRLESPILNIKIRILVVEKQILVYLFGFVGNLNYEFTHLSYSKMTPLVFFTLAEKTLFIFNRKTFENFDVAFYRIFKNVGEVSCFELGFRNILSENIGFCVQLFFGQPHKGAFFNLVYSFFVSLLHHVEDDFWNLLRVSYGLKFPTKFYLEKVASYMSESAYFFSTVTNIFGRSIRGTKEGWKIVFALGELLGVIFEQQNVKEFSLDEEGRKSPFEPNVVPFSSFELNNSLSSSWINNYYDNTLLARISPVLSLCAKTYVSKGGYVNLFVGR